MPTITTDKLYVNGDDQQRQRRYRITWPDTDEWKDDPTSKVFTTFVSDGKLDSPDWKSLGSFSRLTEAQEAADADVGYKIDWNEGS